MDDYLVEADRHVSLFVQIESATGVENAAAIAAVDGVDGVFVGPSDLAASMGVLGQQTHPEVVAAVRRTFADVALLARGSEALAARFGSAGEAGPGAAGRDGY